MTSTAEANAAPTLLQSRTMVRQQGEQRKPIKTAAVPTVPASASTGASVSSSPVPAHPAHASKGRRTKKHPCCDVNGTSLFGWMEIFAVAIGSPSYEVLDRELARRSM
mmetsp:Transcript_85628/g.220419  ORF Transcript_85628/g.220419 Transcript_85628/m.220419 type:complete len:108 (-) Transcript_85628:307-630(-)